MTSAPGWRRAMPCRKRATRSAPTTGRSAADFLPPASEMSTDIGIEHSDKAIESSGRCGFEECAGDGIVLLPWSPGAHAALAPVDVPATRAVSRRPCSFRLSRRSPRTGRRTRRGSTKATRSGGVSDSRSTSSAIPTDSSRDTLSSGSGDGGDEQRVLRHGLRKPLTDIALPPRSRRAQGIQADASGDSRQPRTRIDNPCALRVGQPHPAHVGLLHRVLGIRDRAEQPIRESEQGTAFGFDHNEIIHRLHLGPSRPPADAMSMPLSTGASRFVRLRRRTRRRMYRDEGEHI